MSLSQVEETGKGANKLSVSSLPYQQKFDGSGENGRGSFLLVLTSTCVYVYAFSECVHEHALHLFSVIFM